MVRGVWWATVHGPAKEWDITKHTPGIYCFLGAAQTSGPHPSLPLGAGAPRREGCKRHGTDDPKPTHQAPSADPQPVWPASSVTALTPQASSSTKTIHPTQASLTTHFHRQQASCPWRRHSVRVSQEKDFPRSSIPITSPAPALHPPRPKATSGIHISRATRALEWGLGQAERTTT